MNGPATDNSSPQSVIAEGARASARGEFERALCLLTSILETAADNPMLHNELGVVHYQMGDFSQAETCFRRATSLMPDFVRAWTNLGACFNETKDNNNAIRCYRRALEINPRMADTWGNMAKAWTDQEEFELAVYSYRKALELTPRTELKRGLAKAYRKAGRHDRSEQLLREVLTESPNDAAAHFSLALTLLHEEKYREATTELEWRMHTKEMIQHQKDLYPIFNRPHYKGEDLTDKTLLLHTEQGFGDNIQFARFIRLVRPKVRRLVMWCRPGLGRLFQECCNLDAISENVFDLPAFDCQLPLLSVPHFFDPDLASLQNTTPYLSVTPAAGLPRSRLDNLNIGLVWGASDSGFDHANKRIPLHLFNPLLELEGICWHSLQVGTDRTELASTNRDGQIVDHGDELKDFLATAQLIEHLDLVISCDTSVAHLAGAMGKPVWVLLKKEPDWRWSSVGETSIWYPSARLFRQQSHGDWSLVIKRLTRELTYLTANPNTVRQYG